MYVQRRALVFGTASLGAEGLDMRTADVGALGSVSSTLSIGVLARWREVTHLIDDPALADDGLRVGDAELHVGLARSFASNKLVVGGSASYTGSTIFGTSGSTWSLGTSAVVAPNPWSHLLLVADGFGPTTRYADATGSTRRAAQPRRWRGSVALVLPRLTAANQQVYVDYERVTSADRSEFFSLATDAGIDGVFLLRTGVAWRRAAEAGSRWARSLGAGFQLRISSIVLDYGYAASLPADDLAPRHHFGVAWVLRERR